MNDRFGQDRDPTGREAIASIGSGGFGAGSVGEVLRAERQRRGWTLADAEIYLKIRRSMLEAIEQGHFELLPGRAYALAFARTYAEFLGLNAEDIVARCREEMRHTAEPETATKTRGSIFGDIDLPRVGMAAAAAIAVILAGLWMFEGGGDGAARVDAQAPQVLPAREGDAPRGLASPIVVPSGPGVAAAMPPPPPPAAQPGQAGPAGAPAARAPGGSTDPTAAQASPLPATPQQQSAQATAARSAAAVPPAQPVSRISLKANGDTWVEIRDQAGASVLARTLRNGEVYNVPDRPGLVLGSGRINTIEVRVDGQVVTQQGRPARREMPLDPSWLLQNAQAPAAPAPAAAPGAAGAPPAGAEPPAATPPAAPPRVPPRRAAPPANGAAPASPPASGN